MKIFVSYSRRDAHDFAAKISEALDGEHSVFTDVNDIQIGDIWSNTIEENIFSCDLFIVIVTRRGLESSEVEKEVLLAKKNNKKIIPCIYGGTRRYQLKWGLERYQGVEFADKHDLGRYIDDKIFEYQNKLQPRTESGVKSESNTETSFSSLSRELVKEPKQVGKKEPELATDEIKPKYKSAVTDPSIQTKRKATDVDNCIANYIIQELKSQSSVNVRNDEVAMIRIKEASEKAKIELSDIMSTEVNLPFLSYDSSTGSNNLVLTLSRSKLEELLKPIIEKCEYAILQAIRGADLKPTDIDKVILTGGHSRMPIVRQFVATLLGKEPERGIDPMEAVAMGAAIQGAIITGNETTDKARIIGIDLGTTNSAASVMIRGKLTMIPAAEGTLDGRNVFPSYVAFTSRGQILTGELARRQKNTNSKGTITAARRKMGTDFKFNMNNKKYNPQQISSFILQKIKRDSEAFLGEKVNKAVITVPAYFNDFQRQATKDAGEIAGLEVVRIINEPTAASLAYKLDELNKDLNIMVFSFGKNSIDVTISKIRGGMFEIQSAVNSKLILD